MAEADSVVAEGQAPEAPAFGYDDTQDTSVEAPEPTQEQPDEPQTTTEEVDPVEQERGYLRQADYTQKTQDLARERDAFRAEREQLRNEIRQERERLQQEFRERTQVPPAASVSQQLQQLANDPSLSQADRQGLSFVAGMAQENESLKSELAQLKQTVEELAPQYKQTLETVQSLSQAQQREQNTFIQKQHDEAVRVLGKETVDQNLQAAGRLLVAGGKWDPMTNPKTGQPYTFAEAVAAVSGRTVEETQRARDENGRFRKEAKAKASNNGAHPSSSPDGSYSREDAIAEIRANQGSMAF